MQFGRESEPTTTCVAGELARDCDVSDECVAHVRVDSTSGRNIGGHSVRYVIATVRGEGAKALAGAKAGDRVRLTGILRQAHPAFPGSQDPHLMTDPSVELQQTEQAI